MRQRLYPETIPALASFWLKTIHVSGYRRRQWRELNHLLKGALSELLLDGPSREAMIKINNWIQDRVILGHQAPQSVPPHFEPVRASLNAEHLTTHIFRLLNEWMPVEVARLLIDDSESMASQDDGMPVLAIGSALERLLVREHPSPKTLEMLLDSQQLSPEYVYPAHLEVLQDAVLSRLGRTKAPMTSVIPATLLCVAPNSHLPADYREALRQAFVVQRPTGEEVHVPIAPTWALRMMKQEPVRIGSIIVTMDGRSWEAKYLESSEQHAVVYRPVGQLRIDYSGDHARLRAPWPENRVHWSGGGYCRDTFKIFGREWHVSKWEVDAERTWLHLVFARVLSVSEIAPVATGTKVA
jgi:hypothetical protein